MIDKSVVYLAYKSRIVYQELYQQVKLVYSVLSNLSQINNNNLQMSMPYLYTRIEPEIFSAAVRFITTALPRQ